MDFNLNAPLLKQAMGKEQDLQLWIGMSGVPQVRVGIIGRAMRFVGNHIFLCNSRIYIASVHCKYCFNKWAANAFSIHFNVI